MNANARKWVEALRSGEFEQATGALRKDERFCCLGVACELYHRELGNTRWISDDGYFVFATDEDGENASELPASVRDWLGLRDKAGVYVYGAGVYGNATTDCLINDNDRGASFEEIATTIEKEPEGLFKEGVK